MGGSPQSLIFDAQQNLVLATVQETSDVIGVDANGQVVKTIHLKASQPTGMALDATKVSVVYTPPSGAKAASPKAPSAAACAGKIGWHYDNEGAPTQIQFCPAACTQVRTGGKLGIAFGCAPPPLL